MYGVELQYHANRADRNHMRTLQLKSCMSSRSPKATNSSCNGLSSSPVTDSLAKRSEDLFLPVMGQVDGKVVIVTSPSPGMGQRVYCFDIHQDSQDRPGQARPQTL